ncbi:MAG: hypothetical protein IPM81_20070 [Saprospirales bacterium]|nr:hypothetical protein [Saprospirales bacterium]
MYPFQQKELMTAVVSQLLWHLFKNNTTRLRGTRYINLFHRCTAGQLQQEPGACPISATWFGDRGNETPAKRGTGVHLNAEQIRLANFLPTHGAPAFGQAKTTLAAALQENQAAINTR